MVPRQVSACLAVYFALPHHLKEDKRHEASIARAVPLSPRSRAIYASAVTTRPIAWARGLLVAKGLCNSSIKYSYKRLVNYKTTTMGVASVHLGCKQQSASEMLARVVVELKGK